MDDALKKKCTGKSLLKIYRKARDVKQQKAETFDVASVFVNDIYYCHSMRCK